MSFARALKISLSFVGLLVGAGFATGQEVVQYFVSFGSIGIWGALLAGVIMTIAGAVILQLGSFFLADEHNFVFRNVSHPVMSKFLDVSVTATMFAIGFVMLAGAGANLEQQFGLPAWIGSAIMLVIVMATGLLDVDKVSSVISFLTPLIIVAVIVAFVYTMMNLPSDVVPLNDVAQQQDSPVSPWLLSAINYNGLALMLGVSMCLVIGGNYSNPREVGLGGLGGGLLYTAMLLMAAVTLLLNMDEVATSDVPMLQLFESMHPVMASIMVWIIFAMIYNTCIGMFYALGKRLTVNNPRRYTPVFLVTCLVGYAVSFVGFETLMTYVYPVIGYVGIVMVLTLTFWWVKHRKDIAKEIKIREDIRELMEKREDPEVHFGKEEKIELEDKIDESEADDIEGVIEEEVKNELG
ncbi:hypothetical protein GSS87_03815 [Corynebacterium sp. 4HC-13]|uniref:YkvI family membrane protein n=1 Tax=Corynebacterium anserum TaxID=2684406 RepID=UPI00163B09B3|nr:hypothetical protein [Corynebacterium anserum]MBC2681529.1 hypothetical protein [Corynebacterium anserum]